jgi:hypothetical protein
MKHAEDLVRSRHQILVHANRKRHALSQGMLSPYRMRHLNLAVNTCRQYSLVSDSTLIRAGFNSR